MFVDSLLLLSDAQALTATAASTNVVDFSLDRNVGVGEPMCVVISLDVAADDADGNETYVAALQADDNDSFSSAVEIGSATITRGDVAGSKYVIVIPPDGRDEQYLRLNFTLGGTTPSVTVTAFVQPVNMLQNDYYYANGYTVS